MALLRVLGVLLLGSSLLAAEAVRASPAASEYQVKAVFLFNFSQFVEWPPTAFAGPKAPFVIGVLGRDPFGTTLDEAVRGETANGRPLVVRRFPHLEDVDNCQILFIDRSQGARLEEIAAGLGHRGTLTVTDFEGAARHGAMIGLINESSRIRLRIDVAAARAAGLLISSKLLRPAQIVDETAGGG